MSETLKQAAPTSERGVSADDVPAVSPLGDLHHPLGKVSTTTPIPPVPEDTVYFLAGAVTLALECRLLNEEISRKNHAAIISANPTHDMAYIDNTIALGIPDDTGLSVHVFDAEVNRERLRFDMFPSMPHYHYLRGSNYHIVVPYDVAGNGDMLAWTLAAIRDRLPSMLRNASADDLAEKLDVGEVRRAVNELEAAAQSLAAKTDRLVIPGAPIATEAN
jgi:hypothetical protein